ncbi:MAG: GIY-YIG nuclease family protein [Candidatus Pacebacteria bacterium]|nr:GIY-YIG nuclease family protein [Candidatus Paceibacterota bacterium]
MYKRNPTVYIMTNQSKASVYVGVTGDLLNRVKQHKDDIHEGFTKRYKCHRLVWYEQFQYIQEAIAREKQIKKRMNRIEKEQMIESDNPNWLDLADDWY